MLRRRGEVNCDEFNVWSAADDDVSRYVASIIGFFRPAFVIYSPTLSMLLRNVQNSSRRTRIVRDLRKMQKSAIARKLIEAANTPLAWIE